MAACLQGGYGRGASIGQVWTRHLAPAAPASRPSSPSQFHDCPCHADSALQFVPSLVPGWGKSRAASTGFRALSPSDRVWGVAFVVSHFGSHRRTGMLACAGPSRPHTCVSGSPGRGGWGGQRSPLWATATGPGLFRSLGFKNPSGYWLFGGQHTAIQRVGRLGGAEAPACVVCVFACAVVPCAKFQHFSEGGRGGGGWQGSFSHFTLSPSLPASPCLQGPYYASEKITLKIAKHSMVAAFFHQGIVSAVAWPEPLVREITELIHSRLESRRRTGNTFIVFTLGATAKYHSNCPSGPLCRRTGCHITSTQMHSR